MKNTIQFLIQNTDVLKKVKEGKASLVGISIEEQEAILNVFFNEQDKQKVYYWQ